MKQLLFIGLLLNLTTVHAKIDLKKLSGTWVSYCLKGQKEVYEFKANTFVFKRELYSDPQCQKFTNIETTEGKFQIGEETFENKANPAGTFKIAFVTKKQSKVGMIWVNEEHSNMRISSDSANPILNKNIYSKMK